MHVIVSCKTEEDTIKHGGARVFTTFFLLYVYGEFFSRSRTANSTVHDPIRLDLELSPDFMVVLVTCKSEEDSIKNEGARVFTTLYIHFSDTQGQLTP